MGRLPPQKYYGRKDKGPAGKYQKHIAKAGKSFYMVVEGKTSGHTVFCGGGVGGVCRLNHHEGPPKHEKETRNEDQSCPPWLQTIKSTHNISRDSGGWFTLKKTQAKILDISRDFRWSTPIPGAETQKIKEDYFHGERGKGHKTQNRTAR